MTFPLSVDEVRAHVAEMLKHLPEGLMRDEMTAQSESPEQLQEAFEALCAYYAGDEENRRAIRAIFYSLETGQSWAEKRDGPTSGELEEQMGTRVIPPLPEELVKLVREKLMPIVSEHTKAVDPGAEVLAKELEVLGLVPVKKPEPSPFVCVVHTIHDGKCLVCGAPEGTPGAEFPPHVVDDEDDDPDSDGDIMAEIGR